MTILQTCPECGLEFEALNGLRCHLNRMHGLNAKVAYDLLNPGKGYCVDCSAQTKFVTFQQGYQNRCLPCSKIYGANIAAISRRANYQPAWNAGKTKDTDESVAKISIAVKRNITINGHWMLGRTKETHEHIAIAAAKRSSTVTEQFASGRRRAWHRGLTILTSPSLARMGRSISASTAGLKHWTRRNNQRTAHCRILSARRYQIEPINDITVKRRLDKVDALLYFDIDPATYTSNYAKINIECLQCGTFHRLTWKKLFDGKRCNICFPHTGWSLGLSRKNDQRLANIGDAVSIALKTKHVTHCNDDKRISRWKQSLAIAHRLSNDEIRSRLNQYATKFIWNDSTIEIYTTRQRTKLHLICRECNNIQFKSLEALELGSQCHICCPLTNSSKWQNEIFDFVQRHVTDASFNDRNIITPKELDIWIPSKRFAIECHGLYWHSSAAGCANNAAENKRLLCFKQNISLLQLYEDEWQQKCDIVKSMILHRLGKSQRIFARKCHIDIIDTQTAKEFLNDNHLDGYAPAKHKLGLFYEEKLIGVMTLRRPIHKRWSNYVEICRMAFMKNVQVIGGVSKLISAAKKINPTMSLLSYVDTRLGGIGSGYHCSGMTLQSTTAPRFWWTDYKNRYDRFSIRANKKLGVTQKQLAQQKSMTQIWGPSNFVYTFETS